MHDRSLGEAVGKTVKTISQDVQRHGLDNKAVLDGMITIEFTDGSRLEIEGVECNDSTGATDWEWTP